MMMARLPPRYFASHAAALSKICAQTAMFTSLTPAAVAAISLSLLSDVFLSIIFCFAFFARRQRCSKRPRPREHHPAHARLARAFCPRLARCAILALRHNPDGAPTAGYNARFEGRESEYREGGTRARHTWPHPTSSIRYISTSRPHTECP